MLTLTRSLSRIARWKAQTAVEERHAADLIDLHLRDCEAQLRQAKGALASLLVRQRGEEEQLTRLKRDSADMVARTKAALAAGEDALAQTGAEAIADLQNQIDDRRDAVATLDAQVAKTRRLLEGANRRLLTLRQAAVTAKAEASRRQAGAAVAGMTRTDAFEAAERLIERLGATPDLGEHAEAMAEIDASLGSEAARDALAGAGFGAKRRTDAASVLERLRGDDGPDGGIHPDGARDAAGRVVDPAFDEKMGD